MKELDGFNIPDINPTADGTCLGDPVAASNAASRGWWTCGSYTRSTGIYLFFSLGSPVVMLIQTSLPALISSRGELGLRLIVLSLLSKSDNVT